MFSIKKMIVAYRNRVREAGFTLVETLVTVAIFTMIFMAVYATYAKIFQLIAVGRIRSIAMALTDEKIEIARNLPYADVGTLTGLPHGKIMASTTEIRSNIPFLVTTVVRSIDDPFDGTVGGSPHDFSPADYKLVDITVACSSCANFSPLAVTTYVAPKSLEISSTTNGALFVNAIDANGQIISGASVHIANPSTTPPISIDDVTGLGGTLQLVDIPPGVESYQISVTKGGYTMEQTRQRTAVNPNPTKPHATIAAETVTSLTFSIDNVSTMVFSSLTNTCAPVPNVDFQLTGAKLIGTSPSVLKYDAALSTDGGGSKILTPMEWDTYSLSVDEPGYELIGTNALSPIVLAPGETKDIQLILGTKEPKAIMVTVKDAGTGLPISTATTKLVGGSINKTLITGRGFLKQTDWSGGAGQATSTDTTKYFSSDGNVSVTSPAGEVKLQDSFGFYAAVGELTSSTFDTGSASNFHEFTFEPTAQAPQVGAESVRFQIATNNDTTTWVFKGPDGTASTYYGSATSSISSVHNGDRYVRYNMFLSTASTTFTPNVADAAFTFTSDCVPPGQVTYDDLSNGDYELTVSKTGYQTYSATTTVSSNWKAVEVVLVPN